MTNTPRNQSVTTEFLDTISLAARRHRWVTLGEERLERLKSDLSCSIDSSGRDINTNIGEIPIVPREGAAGELFGFESTVAKQNPLQSWLLGGIETFRRARNKPKLRAVDIGGASGYWAMELAKRGVDVVIIDRNSVGGEEIIPLRNNYLKQLGANTGQLSLHIGDVLGMNGDAFMDACDKRPADIVTAFRVIHFLQPNQFMHMVKLVKGAVTPGSMVALTYDSLSREEAGGDKIYKFHHCPEEVSSRLRREGFRLVTQDKCSLTGYSQKSNHIIQAFQYTL